MARSGSPAGAFELLEPARLEGWYREHQHEARFDISSSGVDAYSLSELCSLTELSQDELAAVVFEDETALGSAEVRAAVASRFGDGDPRTVLVTHGSSEAIFLVMVSTLRTGDHVVAHHPTYHSLVSLAHALRCRVTSCSLENGSGFGFDVERLVAALRDDTRMVVVNAPHNPTGATLTREELTALVDAVAHVGAILVWDAAFQPLVYDSEPLPDPRGLDDRCVVLGTLSKAYGLPGLRVGWCVAEPAVVERCVGLRDSTTLALSPLVEVVARRAVDAAEELLRPKLEQATRNLRVLRAWMAEHDELVEWTPPRGGVCCFPRFAGAPDSERFCRRLLEATGVLLVPGTAFGVRDRVRLGFGGRSDLFDAGLARLSSYLTAPLR